MTRLAFWTFVIGAWCASTHATELAPVTYNRDIRPILAENCFACHGPDQNTRKAKLRLDIREEAIAKNAIVPGRPEESELITRIFSEDPDDLMPPASSHKSLTVTQKELLRRWIAEGAADQRHWAHVPPVKPAGVPSQDAIDFLVRQRLVQKRLRPSSEADRRTLIRRLSWDLLGLPPPPEEVRAFEQDSSPTAYQRLVEKMLASPAYGERMAIGWLDVVRFADTIGYHSDNPRNVWPYRDYVIRAFNENKPFDQFTREQLAGDLLPGSTLEHKVASAFNRLLLSTEEGGAQPKDYEARMLTDRVRAVGTVWLGQTLGCAQCHDHKFDPITSRDFYAMGAFFADIQEPIIGKREPGLLVPNDEQAAEIERLGSILSKARQLYEQPRPELLALWEEDVRPAILEEPRWTILHPEDAQADPGGPLRVDLDGAISAEKDPAGGVSTYRIKVRPPLQGLAGFRLEALRWDRLPGGGPGRGQDGRFVLTEFAVEDAAGRSIELTDATATLDSIAGPALSAVDGNTRTNNGWNVPGTSGASQAIYFTLQESVGGGTDELLTFVLRQTHGGHAVLGRFRLAATTDPAVVRALKTTRPPDAISRIVQTPPAARSREQAQELAAYHRGTAPQLAGLRDRLAVAQRAKDDYEATVPHCLVSLSMEKARTVRLLPRGDWMNETGEIMQPALPVYLAGPSSGGKPLTRLDLANWLVSPENPLTGRVFVNRLWKQFFGIGLSKVLEDLGAQGETPPNQALLDWLACEFRESGWDVKHVVRLMVNSHTYRQVSTTPRDLQAQDPDNRELARQSRWRLEAELVRDNILSIAGLLVRRVGGPSIKPYQPEGYWENLNFPVRTYEASPGQDQYRRGLYTWWQRSYPHPSLLALDAPTREECAAERSRSNIPQQALVLLNDPTYVEAARVFAARILREGGPDVTSRLTWAFQQTLARAPRPEELPILFNLIYKQIAHPKHAPDPALLTVGYMPAADGLDKTELAVWTSVARVLLNLHETITRS